MASEIAVQLLLAATAGRSGQIFILMFVVSVFMMAA
jgi:hypothetical protein